LFHEITFSAVNGFDSDPSILGEGAFHRLRYGFGTLNQGMYELKVLQSMMRHKSSQTTQRYMNIETQVKRTAQNLFVPDVLKAASG
jgi:site-specific recombinase XerD